MGGLLLISLNCGCLFYIVLFSYCWFFVVFCSSAVVCVYVFGLLLGVFGLVSGCLRLIAVCLLLVWIVTWVLVCLFMLWLWFMVSLFICFVFDSFVFLLFLLFCNSVVCILSIGCLSLLGFLVFVVIEGGVLFVVCMLFCFVCFYIVFVGDFVWV